MPYKVKRLGNRYQVINTETGEAESRPTTKAKAEKQLKLLRGIEHGWQPTGEPDTYTRTMNGKPVKLKVGGTRGTK
jgi:hypothetical protein